MSIVTRADGLGWDVIISLPTGFTVRSIIKDPNGFVVVNGFRTPDTSVLQSTFRAAVRLARSSQV